MRTAEVNRFLKASFRRISELAIVLVMAVSGTTAFAQAAGGDVDPPGRVGRISYLSGPVQLIDARSGQGDPATLNWPITSGIRLATGRLGRAEVRIGSMALRLDDDTELEFTRLDDEAIQIVTLRGSLALRVRNREHLRELDLLTPRDRIVIEDVGRYRIDVDRVASTTAVTAFVGQARILSGRLIFAVATGQRGEMDAAPVTAFRLGIAAPDVFDDWVAARDRRDDAPRSAQYVSPEMTGVESLDEQGTWRAVEAYGPVWFPAYVPTGWVPYRYGRWVNLAPWGWTWIDDAPWGFAPFHYGRWVVVSGTWGWVPGVIVPRPVFAPALVAWFGGPGFGVSISIGAPIGWFPLGPGEVFIPGYPCTRRHVNIVNAPYVTNITNVTVINPPARYVHRDRDRSTWAPGSALVNREPVNRVVTPPPADWQNHSAGPRPPIEPPRDIKKRPTPVPMPRDTERRNAPQPPRSIAPSTPDSGARPVVPASPAPRTDEPRRRQPRPDVSTPSAPRMPAPPVIAPAQPSPPATPTPPATPRAAPPEERRQPRGSAVESAPPARQTAPTPKTRREPSDEGARPRERAQPRVTPQATQPATPAGPPSTAQPARTREPARTDQERAQREQRGSAGENRAERPSREANRPGPRE